MIGAKTVHKTHFTMMMGCMTTYKNDGEVRVVLSNGKGYI